MPRVIQVIATPDVFDIDVVVVAPADGPWLIESEPIAAVLEAVVSLDHLGTDHAKRVVMTKMGTVTVVRNAAIMVAIVPFAVVAMVVGNGASLLLASLLLLGPLLLLFILASLLFLPRLRLPLLLIFFLLLGLLRPLLLLLLLVLFLLVLSLPLLLGIGRYAHPHQPRRAQDSRHHHPVQNTHFHFTPLFVIRSLHGIQPMKRTRRERNRQNEKLNQFPSLPFASHRILSGNYGHIVYTPGPFACQSRTAHAFGQHCSSQLIKGNHQVGLEPLLILPLVGSLSVVECEISTFRAPRNASAAWGPCTGRVFPVVG